jgi:hypothetical protein
MQEMFLVLTLIHFPTGDQVRHIPFGFPRMVTLRECMAMLEAEPTHDTTIPANIDLPSQNPWEVVHFIRGEVKKIEEDSAKSGQPVDAILSCEERDGPEPWAMIVDP